MNRSTAVFRCLLAAIQAVMVMTLTAPLSIASSDGAERLSIDQAVVRTIQGNPDLIVAETAIKKAEASVAKSTALFYPKLSVFTEFSAGDAPSAYLFKTIDQRDLPATVNFNDPGSFSNFETGIMAGLNLYNGGKDSAMKAMAMESVNESSARLSDNRNRIVAAVIATYFTLLKSEDHISIAEQSVATVEEELRVMTVRFEGGGVLKSDILSLEVRLADAQRTLVQARNRRQTVQASLATLMAMDPATEFYLEKDCSCPVDLPGTSEAALSIAFENRPELSVIRRQVEKARLAVTAAGAGYRPKIDMNARYYLDSDSLEYNASKENYTAAVTLTWDLFTGHSTRADLNLAHQDLAAAEAMYDKTRREVVRDVRTAYLDLEDAEKRLDVADRSLAMAEESLKLVKKRYEGGSESITRYLETELALTRARLNRANAYYDGKIAQSGIARSIGLLSTLFSQETPKP